MLASLARAEARPPAPAHPYFSSAVRSLLTLPPNGCRWPLSDVDDEGFSFCGTPRLGQASYCGRHRALSCERVR